MRGLILSENFVSFKEVLVQAHKAVYDSGDDVFLHKRAFTPADLESVARTVEAGDGRDYDNSCFWIHPWIYENYRNGRRINLNGEEVKLYIRNNH